MAGVNPPRLIHPSCQLQPLSWPQRHEGRLWAAAQHRRGGALGDLHCATARVVTPYENKVVISHEGASGGGKSEMLEYAHRQPDGTLLIGRNLETGEKRSFTLPKGCDLRPVTDDMALCHPSLEKGNGKLTLIDAEEAWFVLAEDQASQQPGSVASLMRADPAKNRAAP